MFVLKTLIDKAFDTVAHTAIYLKLLDMNVGGLFHNTFEYWGDIASRPIARIYS
jgi:hypothetical protein